MNKSVVEKILAGENIRQTLMDEALNEAAPKLSKEQVAQLDVDAIPPDDKDIMRAKNLAFKGSTFRGDGRPWGSEASKMAKLITDPYKLIRRAKAVAAKWGSDEGYMSNTGYYHHVGPDSETDVWGPFKRRLQDMGFTADQISKIANYRG